MPKAFECGEIVLINLERTDLEDWSDNEIKDEILDQWQTTKCLGIWKCKINKNGVPQCDMLDVLVKLLKRFPEVTEIHWNTNIPLDFSQSQTDNKSYKLKSFPKELQIRGEYQCIDSGKKVPVDRVNNPLTFESEYIIVGVQLPNNQIRVWTWSIPVEKQLEQLEQDCKK